MESVTGTAENFWALVQDAWNTGIAGVKLGDVFLALAVLLFFLLVRGLFSHIVIAWIKRLSKKTASKIDDTLIRAMAPPLRFVPVVIGIFVASEILPLEGSFAAGADNLNRSLVLIAIFWAIYNAVSPLLSVISFEKGGLTDELVIWLSRVGKILIGALGAAAVVQTWGIQVLPLLAGLGVVGVAVALGAQDVFKNLIGGMFVIGERRFQIGDWVKVEDLVEGTVEMIGFRTTLIRRFDKAPVFVPNAELSENAVTNFSKMTHRRIYWLIGVEYRTTIDQLREIRDGIADYIENNDDFAPASDVATFVRIDSFGDSAINIMLYCFTKTTVWGEWLVIKEELAYKVKEIVEGAGTGFAFPSRSLYLETWPEGAEVYPLSPPQQQEGQE